jgi:hypothetical protein
MRRDKIFVPAGLNLRKYDRPLSIRRNNIYLAALTPEVPCDQHMTLAPQQLQSLFLAPRTEPVLIRRQPVLAP